jgi:hypothetical protein
MAGFSINVKVFPDVFAAFRNLQSDLDRAVESAVYREAEREMTMAKELTPVDTGALRASGRVEGPDHEGGAVVFHLAYGGPAIEYALRVHEDLMMHHTVGQAKFLETPVREEVGSGRAAARIMRDIQAVGGLR